ncbi:hypothetical protein [Mucilaginibacter glaciei]|uniref:Uncharacterized protein n=1 Tax=Mucilaginibacter glaciei TaxID=2772109 RepID=A0A926NQM7_9SPHI|nr:hypothetical protein [Mucilaginibacter glaciei]MBD1393257.1 hypothetical protein [Mucilaginibacter glaciei]
MKRWVEGERLSTIIENNTNISEAHTRKLYKERLKMRRLKALNDRYLSPPKRSFFKFSHFKQRKKKLDKQEIRYRYFLLLIPILLIVSVLGFHYEYNTIALVSLGLTMLMSSTSIWMYYSRLEKIKA